MTILFYAWCCVFLCCCVLFDDEDATPANRKPLDTGESVPQEVPEADNAPAPEMDEDAEY